MPDEVFPVPSAAAREAHIDAARYEELYRRSLEDPDGFWAEQAQILDWITPFTEVRDVSFARDDVRIRWFADGVLNACANCLDRHLPHHADRTAVLWEGDGPADQKTLTYAELHREVCRFANVLKTLGVRKGDRVTIYLPMIPEIAVAALACARIGAVHSVVFGGFSPESIANRIRDCDSRLVITADEGLRGGRTIPLKANVDRALEDCPAVAACIVVRRTGADVAWKDGRDAWYHEAMAAADADCPPEPMGAEDPLFILYTSGSTGKPKGVVHTTGGYLAYAALTHRWVLDYRDGEVYWCTADIGWITGHSYVLYGPLANGATTLLYEGLPGHPTAARCWEICDRHRVAIFYTAPTVIRALMREGAAPVRSADRSSLRLLATVGEPINPEAWRWYHAVVGDGRCPVIDTWWQTETGGILIAPLPGATPLKPGSATRPFFGVRPALLDGDGREIEGPGEGRLCLADSWPGQMRTVFRDHARFVETYFTACEGYYFSGDGCRRDADGYYWITGRVDDVINVAGHRLGTAEIESALVAHPRVAEAAVVGYPHEIKGQGIHAFVTLVAGAEPGEALRAELIHWVREKIGPIAAPGRLQWAPGLPKTRSGKIMRRILRRIAAGEHGDLGDTTTLADPSVVAQLAGSRPPCGGS